MSTILMDLPSELLSSILALVHKSDLLETRLVNSSFRRVATPIAFFACQIDLSNGNRLGRFDDIHSPASKVLSHARKLTIKVIRTRMTTESFKLAIMFIPTIPGFCSNLNELTVQYPTPSDSACNWEMWMNQLLCDQLAFLPAVRTMTIGHVPSRLSESMLPTQLTKLRIFGGLPHGLMNQLIKLLDHLPQLTNLYISTMQYTSSFNNIDGKRLVDWVQSVMEHKSKQHLKMKNLSLVSKFSDRVLDAQDYDALLTFFFFTLPNLDSLNLAVQCSVLHGPKQLTTQFRPSLGIAVRCGFPKDLTISLRENTLVGDAKHAVSLFNNPMSKSNVERLSLNICMDNPLHPWLHCFPHHDITSLHLTGSGRSNDGFTLQKLAQFLPMVPRLARLDMTSMEFHEKESITLPRLLSLESLAIAQCSFDTPAIIEMFVVQSPKMTRLRLFKADIFHHDGILYQPQMMIGNPWALKLQMMMQNNPTHCMWISIPVSNLSLSITVQNVGLYIFLQASGVSSNTPAVFLCHGHHSNEGQDCVVYRHAFKHDETFWLLDQIDRIHAAYENDGNGHVARPSFPTDVHEDAWNWLQKRVINVITCVSLNQDDFKYF